MKNLLLLREKFDKIVSHISDFSFVADTVQKLENFKIYTKKVFMLAILLREAGENARRLH